MPPKVSIFVVLSLHPIVPVNTQFSNRFPIPSVALKEVPNNPPAQVHPHAVVAVMVIFASEVRLLNFAATPAVPTNEPVLP